jgi:tetratricopeptide (TPR) repeat protein
VSQKKFLAAILLLVLSGGAATAQTFPSKASETPSETLSQTMPAIQRGNLSFAKEDYEPALREYRSVPPSAGENYAQALYNIGVCYYELWRTAEAIDFYRRALEVRHGRYPRASYALGVALEDQGRAAEAKEAYKQSIIMSHGEYALANFRLGLLVFNDGDFETAATYFKKAIARSGDHLPASHNNLGVMLARQGRLTEARRQFEIALQQTGGTFDDAAHNLKLCRSLLNAPAKDQIAALKLSGTVAATRQ